MTNNNSKNSRQVTIFRANNFVQISQTGATGADHKGNNEAVADWMDLASKSIGPYMKSHATLMMGSGMENHEIDILLPYIVNVEPGDKDFRKTVFNFYNELTTKIPPTTGKTFEIGLSVDNDKPMSKTNLPIDIEDYVRYRHALSHPWVAKTKQESTTNQLKYFYISDPEANLQSDTAMVVLQDEADAIWLSIRDQPQKINMLLTLLGKDEREYSGRSAEAMKVKDLHFIVKNHAPSFLKAYKEDKFETRYWLKAMIKAGVVTEIGDSYVNTSNNKLLARTEPAMLLFLEDDRQADVVTYLKAATQDILRKPKDKKKLANTK